MSVQIEKRTPAGWVEYLSQEHTPVTLTEFMAGCLSRLLGAQVEATLAAQHTEGMIGAIDDLASKMAALSGLPYANSGAERAALDAGRKQADLERLQALRNGEAVSDAV